MLKLNKFIIQKNCLVNVKSVLPPTLHPALLYHAFLYNYFVINNFHTYSQIGDILFHLYDYILG